MSNFSMHSQTNVVKFLHYGYAFKFHPPPPTRVGFIVRYVLFHEASDKIKIERKIPVSIFPPLIFPSIHPVGKKRNIASPHPLSSRNFESPIIHTEIHGSKQRRGDSFEISIMLLSSAPHRWAKTNSWVSSQTTHCRTTMREVNNDLSRE